MIRFTNAKINLGLNITRRRPDGYHDLLSLFYPVGGEGTLLADALEIIPSVSGRDTLTTLGNPVDCAPEKNLVWKAMQAFRKEVPMLPPVDIVLEKHVPDGAGMGGGSADAAFTLRLLNDMTGSQLCDDELEHMALGLGADCPFFIRNRAAIASGVGERLVPASIDLTGWHLAILKPQQSISTAQAFSMITPREPEYTPEELLQMPVEHWRGRMVNDFEKPMFDLHPHLRDLKRLIYDCGAVYASMTGSGSAFYGLFASPDDAMRCVDMADVPFGLTLDL